MLSPNSARTISLIPDAQRSASAGVGAVTMVVTVQTRDTEAPAGSTHPHATLGSGPGPVGSPSMPAVTSSASCCC